MAPNPEPALTTASGTKVILRDIPSLRPAPKPRPKEPVQKVVVVPQNQPVEDREAFMRWICKEHGSFIEGLLRFRRDVRPASAQDVQQHVLVAIDAWYQKEKGRPKHPRGFLRRIVRNTVTNYNQPWRVDVDPGVDVEEELENATDPEGAAEHREWLARYLRLLPEDVAEVIWLIDGLGFSFDETVDELGLSHGTVSTWYYRGKKKLKELDTESERAAVLGGRRPPGR
jgi:RNA polymerase sigma factor (sigma-70 family)